MARLHSHLCPEIRTSAGGKYFLELLLTSNFRHACVGGNDGVISRVAAMKRSVIEDGKRHSDNAPEYATLLPGYGLKSAPVLDVSIFWNFY